MRGQRVIATQETTTNCPQTHEKNSKRSAGGHTTVKQLASYSEHPHQEPVKSGEKCLSTRSPLWVPQTTQKAESDVEQPAFWKSQFQARTEHMDPLEQLPSVPNLWCHSAGPEGQDTWSVCASLQYLPMSQKSYNRNCCQLTRLFWFAI